MFFLKRERMSQLQWVGGTWLVKVDKDGGDISVQPLHTGLVTLPSGEAGLTEAS